MSIAQLFNPFAMTFKSELGCILIPFIIFERFLQLQFVWRGACLCLPEQNKQTKINKITLHQGTDLDNSCVRVRD